MSIISKLVYDIVSCIEHSSYVYNTQVVHGMYKQFGIPDEQVKKADFIASKNSFVNKDALNIMNKLQQNVK